MAKRQSGIKGLLKRWFIDALGAMAQGLFASLIIGLIIQQLGKIPWLSFLTPFAQMLSASSPVVGAAIGVAVAYGLKHAPLVVFSSAATGALGYSLGGPVGAFLASLAGAELAGLLAGKTKVDIVVLPFVAIVAGGLVATWIGPGINAMMTGIGSFINLATELQPIPMGILVSVVMGMALTAPISSAAIAISLDLSGLAAGAATVGCCVNMLGFAVASYRENGVGGLISQGLGTSMLQMPNILRNPRTWIPPTLAAAITGPIATCLFHLEMNGPAVSSGMGTCGLVGQIGVYTGWVESGKVITAFDWAGMVLVCFILPAVLSVIFCEVLRKKGWIKEGDLKL